MRSAIRCDAWWSLLQCPVGSVAFGDVARRRMVHQALDHAVGQNQVSHRYRDEAFSARMKPEFCSAHLADVAIPTVHVTVGSASQRPGKNPSLSRLCLPPSRILTALQNDRHLPCDRQVQRPRALVLLDPETSLLRMYILPTQSRDLTAAQSSEQPEPHHVANHGDVHRLYAPAPARQDFRRRCDGAPASRVEPSSARAPQRHRASQTRVVDAGSTIDRAEENHELVGRNRSDASAYFQKSPLDFCAVDSVETPFEPVVGMLVQHLTIHGPGYLCEGRPSGEVCFEGGAQGG